MKPLNNNSISFGSIRLLLVKKDAQNSAKTTYEFKVTKDDSTKYADIRPRGVSGYIKERQILLELEQSGAGTILRVLANQKTGAKYAVASATSKSSGEIDRLNMKKFDVVRNFISDFAKKKIKFIAFTKNGQIKKSAISELQKALEFLKK